MYIEETKKILGARIDNLTLTEVLEKITEFLNNEKFHQIATINPEFILQAQKDENFKNILNSCDLNIADGIGIAFAFWRLGEKLKARVAGIDLMEEILKISERNNSKIFLAANNRGLSTWEETRDAILKKYPKLEISGVNLDKNITSYELLITSYDIIFCNFGALYQEKFLNSLKTAENSLPHHLWTDSESGSDNLQPQRCRGKIKLAMGVGGSFDYLTGKIKRAPAFMRKVGLEWLWRLVQQPWRIKRIITATIVFPIKIIFDTKNE